MRAVPAILIRRNFRLSFRDLAATSVNRPSPPPNALTLRGFRTGGDENLDSLDSLDCFFHRPTPPLPNCTVLHSALLSQVQCIPPTAPISDD